GCCVSGSPQCHEPFHAGSRRDGQRDRREYRCGLPEHERGLAGEEETGTVIDNTYCKEPEKRAGPGRTQSRAPRFRLTSRPLMRKQDEARSGETDACGCDEGDGCGTRGRG